jgi:dihydroxyacetone kinase
VLYGDVADLLTAAGVELVAPEVGEVVTSLDMAGCSLSVTWLDDELERLWLAPADTPAWRRGNAAPVARSTPRRRTAVATTTTAVEEASEASLAAAAVARRAVAALHDVVEEHKDELGQLDAVAGDGDHGIGMSRGSTAATEAAEQTRGGIQSVLSAAGAAFGDRAGGTSGILRGVLLDGIGQGLGNTEAVTDARVVAAVQQAVQKLQTFSKAKLGDKTMLDALLPFVDALAANVEAGQSLGAAWEQAAEVAVSAAQETASLTPRIGRARPLAERSVGTPDPGAVSLGMIVTAVGVVLAGSSEANPAR